MKQIEFTLDEPTILLNKWQRMHWRARKKHAEELSWKVRKAISGQIPESPIDRCVVMIERHSSQLPDWDGLYGGIKPLLDCLIPVSDRHPHGLGIIQDDSPKHIVSLSCIPKKCKQNEGFTKVTIMEVG